MLTKATYQVPCECGQAIEASASQAGDQIVCRCGRNVKVPSLRQLRQLAGEAPPPANPFDVLYRMKAEGELPWGETCAFTGKPTADRATFVVECMPGNPSVEPNVWLRLLMTVVMSPVLYFLAAAARSSGRGSDVVLQLPMRIDRTAKPEVEKLRQSELRRLLCSVPIYADLLRQFPAAQVRVI